MENKRHSLKRAFACAVIVIMMLSAGILSGFVGQELPEWSQMFAAKASAASSDGDFIYTVSDGKATITGYNTSISGDLVIPETLGGYPVTGIGDKAFEYCTALKSITIPDSVTSIGDYAFQRCTGLTSVTIPDSVTSIGNHAFSGCTGLTSVNISDLSSWCKITFIGDDSNPLIYAQKLYINGKLATDITIPDGITSIKAYAFGNCTGLTSITLPDSVTSIEDYAFCFCTGLTSITLPDSVTSIGEGAFGLCTGLTSITLPDSVTSIGDYAFCGCSGLTSVTIPDSVTSIGEWAFGGCSGLTSITIPDSVTSIGDYAFAKCTGLTSITIPDSVTSLGLGAFCYCSSLSSIRFEGKPPAFSEKVFYQCKLTAYYPYGISEWKSAIKSSYGGNINWVLYSKGTLVGLKINSLPRKTVYNQGETADYTGLSLSATWSDGLTEIIAVNSKLYQITFSGFSTETPGIKTVTVKVNGKTASFKVGVHKTSIFTEAKAKYPESAHNYTDNLNQTKTYKCPDAIKLVVTFSDKTFVEKDGDYLYVDETGYTGDQLAGKTITVNGDTLTVKLVSDSYGNYYGYSIDKIVVTKIEHTYQTAITKATATADGKTVTACTVCGKVSKTIPIYKASSIKLSGTSYVYNAKVQKPTVTVKNSKGTTLKNGTDYTVAYSSGCKNPGKYAVKVTFKGNYTGSKTLYFTILPGITSSIATTTNSSAIKLTWKAVPGATGYRVFQYDTKTKKYVTVKTLTGTSCTVSKLKSGTTYKFAVRAYSTVNGTVYWASGYKTVTATTNPGTPTLSVTAGAKKATLKWTKRAEATGYVVYMATSKTGKYTKIATIKNNSTVSMTKTGLTTGKTYYFKVAAYKTVSGKTVYSGWSAVKSVKIK